MSRRTGMSRSTSTLGNRACGLRVCMYVCMDGWMDVCMDVCMRTACTHFALHLALVVQYEVAVRTCRINMRYTTMCRWSD